jgi:hypothetical protein
MQSANEKLALAHRHLEKVLAAWSTPTDWDDLAVYGFYCLENAVEAAAKQLGLPTPKNHWLRADLAGELHANHGLPPMSNHYFGISMRLEKLQPTGTLMLPSWMQRILRPRSKTMFARLRSLWRILMTLSELQQENASSIDRVLRWPTKRSKDWTLSFVSTAWRDPNIIAIVAIGSAVRPNVSSTDLDLLTLYTGSKPLKETPPMEVDLRTYSLAGIEDKLRGGHDLLTWSVKFGRVLYQRDNFWDMLVDSWRFRLPLPSAKRARERAIVVYRHLTEILEVGDAQAAREQAISYLTHLVRADLLDKGIYPASRPELTIQMREVGGSDIAQSLEQLLVKESIEISELNNLMLSVERQ